MKIPIPGLLPTAFMYATFLKEARQIPGEHRKGPIRGIMVNLKYYEIKSLDDFWNAIKDVQPGQAGGALLLDRKLRSNNKGSLLLTDRSS